MNNHVERIIKQKTPFKTPALKAEIGIYLMANNVTNQKQQLFKQYGIPHQQYNLLRILRGQYPKVANINLIKERMLDRMSDVSRIVDRLVKMELVTKEPNLIDKRNADIVITEEAIQILASIEQHPEFSQTIVKNLNEDEIDQLNELIDKMVSTLDY